MDAKDTKQVAAHSSSVTHPEVDRATVLDLLEAIEAEERYHSTAAVLTSRPVLRAHHQTLAREDAALVADIRHEMALGAKRHQSRSQRQRRFDRYVNRLVDIYLDDGAVATVRGSPPTHVHA